MVEALFQENSVEVVTMTLIDRSIDRLINQSINLPYLGTCKYFALGNGYEDTDDHVLLILLFFLSVYSLSSRPQSRHNPHLHLTERDSSIGQTVSAAVDESHTAPLIPGSDALLFPLGLF